MALKILKNKKAMFFTVLAISLLSLFILSYSIYSSVQDRGPITKRIEGMNNFVFSLERDMSRQMYISGYRALLGLQNHITSEGVFLTDSEQAIKEAIINGTINGNSIPLMEGYKLEDLNSKISELGDKMNLLVEYSIKEVTVSQDDPWNIKIEILVDSYIKDKGDLAFWNRTNVISSKVEIFGFEDPLYLINTNGHVTNKINKTIYENFVDGEDVSNLSSHVENSYYINSSSAPSFLDRLEGKTTANENGIESLVYLPELSAQEIETKDKSCVDYIYFSDDTPEDNGIQEMPSWFRIDDAHLDDYGVEGLVI